MKGIEYRGGRVVADVESLLYWMLEMSDIRFLFLVRDCLPQDNQQPPHIHGVCPQIQNHDLCVEFGTIDCVVCVSVLRWLSNLVL